MVRIILLACITLLVSAWARAPEPQQERKPLPDPSLGQIAEGVWIHKSYAFIEPWGAVLSQGLVVKSDQGIFLVDTAWTDTDTESLLILIKEELGAFPDATIVTHAHDDKMGGMNTLHAHNIQTWAYEKTNEYAPDHSLTPAQHAFPYSAAATAFEFLPPHSDGAKTGLMKYTPGPGHTLDNIIVYYPPAKVLFGGCLVRPGRSSTMGNTADGDVYQWADTVANVATTFPEADIVVPSHGEPGGRELLDHTISLARKAAAKQ